MKIVFIAHPISGDVKGNLKEIIDIVRYINITYPDVVPFAPYWVDCHALNDDIPEERQRGIKNDTEYFNRKAFDELWVCGDIISTGMKNEIEFASKLGIPIIFKRIEHEKH